MAAEAGTGIVAIWRRRGESALRGCFACFSALRRDERGVASAVELALFAAFVLPPLGSVFDIGMAFSERIKVQQAVQAGAQYASMNVWDSSTSPTAITNVVTNALPTSLQGSVTIAGDLNTDGSVNHSAPYQACYCPTGTTSPYLQSTDGSGTTLTNSNCGSTTCSNGELSGYYVSVAATISYTPVAPYSFAFMSNPKVLTASSVVRVQ